MAEEKNDVFFRLNAKAVILNEKNEVLLVTRSVNEEHGAGKYDLPGGSLNECEDIEEGLKREIEEETGIEVELESCLSVFDLSEKCNKEYDFGKKKISVGEKGIRFLAFYKSGEVELSDEHEKFEWVKLEEAIGRFGDKGFEKDKKISLEKAKNYLEMRSSLDGWKRCQADFENYKKRQIEERKNIIVFSNLNFILELLPVLDNFHASTGHIPADQKESPWVAGIMYIQKQLEKVLADNGVEEIETGIGDEFNPEMHEAIKHETHIMKHGTKNLIQKVLQKGYKINGKVIRAARVIVE